MKQFDYKQIASVHRPRNFTKHIILIILVGILVPLTISLAISTIHNWRTLREENLSLQQRRLSYTAQYLDTQFSTINESLQAFQTQAQTQELMNGPFLPQDEAAAQSALVDLCYAYPSYSNAYICSTASRSVYSAYPETGGVVSYDIMNGSDWFRKVSLQYDYAVMTYPFSQGRYLACVRPQRNPMTLDFSGYCMVKVKASILDSAFLTFSDDDTNLHCITSDGVLLSAQPTGFDCADLAAVIAQNPGKKTAQFQDYLVCWETLSHSNLYIFSMIPRGALNLDSMIPGMFGIGLAIFCIAAGLCITIPYLRRFLEPVNRLAQAMQDTDLDHLVPIELSGRDDEIGTLELCYNKMIHSLSSLLDREYKASLRAQEAQINSLQWQINPHFVNNTLQMIGAIAIEHGVVDIYELLTSFSRMFYYSLKYKGNMVSLQDEFDYLGHYIKIQKARYPGKFQVELQTDDRAAQYEMPKMVLQPIVENCFSHAFSQDSDNWKVTITAALDPCNVCEIRITDNGCGMNEETLSALLQRIREEGSTGSFSYSGSIGLHNVNMRLKLLYGDEYQLEIHSAVGVGTTVLMKLPPQSKGGTNHDPSADR